MKHYINLNQRYMSQNMDMKYRKILDTLCEQLYTESYGNVENMLLALVKKIYNIYESPEGHTDKEISIVHTLYYTFNEYFEQWLKEQGHADKKTIEHFQTDEHNNVLLAHCTDPASMDDMLWDLNNLLISNPNNDVMDTIDYHIACYKRGVKNADMNYHYAQ